MDAAEIQIDPEFAPRAITRYPAAERPSATGTTPLMVAAGFVVGVVAGPPGAGSWPPWASRPDSCRRPR
jgi:hypothetical protein